MAFGSKNKKRESWSARPLSMILSDNVWLFKNKSRNSVEKAMQQAGAPSGRQIEPARPTAVPAAPAVSVHSASARRSTEEAARSATATKAAKAVTKPETEQVPAPASAEKKDAPPFLTLNLDASTQRLDVPEQYLDESVISDEFYSQVAGTPEPEGSSEELSESVLGPLGGMTIGDTAAPSLQPSAPTEEAASATPTLLNASKAASALDPASVSSSAPPDLVFTDNSSEPASRENSATSAASAARESTIDSAHSSSSTTIDGVGSDSYVLGSNRKVVVGRGVYIFDPTEPGAVRELQLSAAESFNPFEFE